MKSNIMNRSIAFLFLLLFISSLISLTLVIIEVPSIGVVLKKEDNGRYYINSVEPAGQAVRAGLRIGDQILEVNGKPASQFPNVTKYNSLEYADHVLIMRSNHAIENITFSQGWTGEHSAMELLLQLYIPGVSLIIFSAFSSFLYAQRRQDSAAIILILFFLSIGISYYSSAASHRSDPLGLSIIYVVVPLIPLLFMSFMNIFLRRYDVQFISGRSLIMLFAMVGSVSIFSLVYIWSDLFSAEVLDWLKIAYSGVVMLGNLVCVFKLVEKFIKHRQTQLNSLFTITLISHLVAFTPFATMNLLPQIFGARQILPAAFTALFLFVLPVVYFYLSTSNQLFDIDFILTKFKYYTALALIPSAMMTIMITIVSEHDSNWPAFLGVFIVVYVGVTLFLYVKELLDQRFRPRLFKAIYSYQDSLDRFSRNVARVMKQSDLEAVLKQEINALLPVSRLTFLTVDQQEKLVLPLGESLEEKVISDFLLGTAGTFNVGELIDLPGGLGLIIGAQRSRFHVLWIGMKTNHTRFNSDELKWLKTMANYSSIVFENLFLIEGLIEDLEAEVRKEHTTSPWVLRLLFNLSESERRKLAADLHDSALQDQLIWYRKLESIIMDHPFTEQLDRELEDIKEGLLDVIHQIRETCNELRPPLLKEMGVIEAVESIIERARMRVNFEVQFLPGPFQKALHEEQIISIYRIVQELLSNAGKHSQAKLVTLELELRQGIIYFRYHDDGIGIDVNHMSESFEHMGLSGIKERVASLEGEITFYSESGQGLEIVILLPEMMPNGQADRSLTHDTYLVSG